MKNNKLTFLSAGIAMAIASSAQAYQAEVEVRYSDGEIEAVDTQSYDVSGTYYLSAVDTKRGPLAEAAFLDRVSGVTLGLGSGELEALGTTIDTDTQGIRLHWIEYSGLTADLGYSNSDIEVEGFELEIDSLSVGLGLYIAANATLGINYSDIELSVEGLGEAEGDSLSLDYKIVVPGKISYAIDASLIRTEFEDAGKMNGFNVGGTIYPLNELGIGLSYSKDVLDLAAANLGNAVIALDEINSDIYSLHANWFVTESISLDIEYLDGEIEDIDLEQISVGASFRF